MASSTGSKVPLTDHQAPKHHPHPRIFNQSPGHPYLGKGRCASGDQPMAAGV